MRGQLWGVSRHRAWTVRTYLEARNECLGVLYHSLDLHLDQKHSYQDDVRVLLSVISSNTELIITETRDTNLPAA